MNAGCQSCQDLLLDLLYGELDAAEQARVEAHLGTCESCRAEQARLGSTRTLMDQLPTEEPARGIEAILQAAEREVRLRADATATTDTGSWLSRLGGWLRGHPFGVTAALAATVVMLVVSVDLEQEQAKLGAVGPVPADEAMPAAPAPSTTASAEKVVTRVGAPAEEPAPALLEDQRAADGLLDLAADPAPKPAEVAEVDAATEAKLDTANRQLGRLEAGAKDAELRKVGGKNELGGRSGEARTGGGPSGAARARPRAAAKREAKPLLDALAAPADPAPEADAEGAAFGQNLLPGGGAGVASSTGGLSLPSKGSGTSVGSSSSFGARDLGLDGDKAGDSRKDLQLGDDDALSFDSKVLPRSKAAASSRTGTLEATVKQAPAKTPASGTATSYRGAGVAGDRADTASSLPAVAEAAPAATRAPTPEVSPAPAIPQSSGSAVRMRAQKAKRKMKKAQEEAAAPPASAPAPAPAREGEREAMKESEDLDEVSSPVERRQAEKSDLLRSQLDRASALVDASRCADALPILDAILHQGDSPWRAEAYLYRGTCRSRLGLESDARSDFALAASLDSGRWSRKARKQLRLMERSEAVLDAAEAAEADAPARAMQPASE